MADERSAPMLELNTVDIPEGSYDVATRDRLISLHRERREQDMLSAEEGISLAPARGMLPGIEEMDLQASGAVAAA